MDQNAKILLLAFAGLALMSGFINWLTGSASVWLALGAQACIFGVLWRAGAFRERR